MIFHVAAMQMWLETRNNDINQSAIMISSSSPVTKRVEGWVLNAPIKRSQSMLGSFGWTKTTMANTMRQKFGFIKRVDKGRIATVKDLKS